MPLVNKAELTSCANSSGSAKSSCSFGKNSELLDKRPVGWFGVCKTAVDSASASTHFFLLAQFYRLPEQFTMAQTTNSFGLDPKFYELCLNTLEQAGNQSPVSPTSTLVCSSNANKLVKLDADEGSVDPGWSRDSRLTDKYPDAYSDFHGLPSGPGCIFKTGPAWPKPAGPEAQPFIRELRPVHGDHPIVDSWLQIGARIGEFLKSCGIKWTSVDPVGVANAGDDKLFCPLLVWIGVPPDTLAFEDAKTAAEYVKVTILLQAGFSGIEVAIRESEVTSSASGPKLLSFNPNPFLDPIPAYRKPFTPVLGISIAPAKKPYYEGTGGLYFCLRKDDAKDNDGVVLLTSAHVARPPPVNTGNNRMSRRNNSQPREEIAALGTVAYQKATSTIMTRIATLGRSMEGRQLALTRLGEFETEHAMDKAKDDIKELNDLHDEVTKFRTNANQRKFGFVLHAEPIVVSDGPDKFTRDWALIELYSDMIDWSTFLGNKVYIGGNLSEEHFLELMFPHAADRAGYQYPQDGFLQAYDVMPQSEILQPQQLNVHGDKATPVIKNGMATGTTVGWLNGLPCFVRVYTEYGIDQTSLEAAILPYGGRGAFSARGDSGAVILGRDGRIVALLTGRGGSTDGTDITYGTPYWWVEAQVKEAFPGCHLYPVVN